MPTSPPHRNMAHSSWACGMTAWAATHAAVPADANAVIFATSSASMPTARASSTPTTRTCVPALRPAPMPTTPAVRVTANTTQKRCHRQPNPMKTSPA